MGNPPGEDQEAHRGNGDGAFQQQPLDQAQGIDEPARDGIGLGDLEARNLRVQAEEGVRVNAIAPGGVYAGQPKGFVKKLTNLIPLGRMADRDEYKASILYLITDASSYMTGSTLVVDGGRTCW